MAPPPPAVDVRGHKGSRGRALKLAQDFGGACDCCAPPPSWKGSTYSPTAPTPANGIDGRAALIAEVENEAERMSQWERIAAIFTWNQMADAAREEQQWTDAGSKYARALAYAQALDEDAEDDAAWVAGERQRQELSRLRGEVLCGLSMLHLQRAWLCVEDNSAAPRERIRFHRSAMEYGKRAVQADDSSLRAHLHLAVAAAELARELGDTPVNELAAKLATGGEEEGQDSDSLLEMARASKAKALGLRQQSGPPMPAELFELQQRLDAALA